MKQKFFNVSKSLTHTLNLLLKFNAKTNNFLKWHFNFYKLIYLKQNYFINKRY